MEGKKMYQSLIGLTTSWRVWEEKLNVQVKEVAVQITILRVQCSLFLNFNVNSRAAIMGKNVAGDT
jgi:hypothetical protein